MVGVANYSSYKWLIYIGVSLIINLFIAAQFTIESSPQPLAITQSLKVNLFAQAAPLKEIPKQEIFAHKPIKQVVTKPQAKETITRKTKLVKQEAPVVPVVKEMVQDQGQDRSTVIHQAQYRKQTPPVYPRRAFELGQAGLVMLHAEILPNGIPSQLKVAKSSGHKLLDMAAIKAVKEWEFEPLYVNGTSVVSWVSVPVNFVIR